MTPSPAKPSSDSGQTTFRVLLPLPLGDGYDYLVPPKSAIKIGSLVRVPLGSKESIGVVWAKGSGTVPANKLKAITEVIDVKPLPDVTRVFVDWVASYTLMPVGSILKMVLGGQYRPLKDKDKLNYPKPKIGHLVEQLTDEQQKAATALEQDVQSGLFTATLLDGVTGSGKTEVYAAALAQCFKEDKQALVLLPEISMTAALFNRLESRFGVAPTLWHSGLTEKQRRMNWHAIKQGKAKFVLGARSALFLPYDNLG